MQENSPGGNFCRAAPQSCRERESREIALCEQGAQHVLATSDGAVGARVLRLVDACRPRFDDVTGEDAHDARHVHRCKCITPRAVAAG